MYDPANIFARIIQGELPAKKVYEDHEILAFYDTQPVAPIHVLVIPKGQYSDFTDFITTAPQPLIKNYFNRIIDITKKLGLELSGYRLITNKGRQCGQQIMHFHTHILSADPVMVT